MKIKKFNFWLIVAVLSFLIGTGVRFYYGLSTDFWTDEGISYLIAENNSWLDLIFSTGSYKDFVHPPLYYIFLKLILLIGNQDWFLRSASLLWFFPSALLIYLIGKKFDGRNTGLLALSLFSLHPFFGNLAFQVRPYSMTIFFVLLSIYLFLQIIFSKNPPKEWLVGLILAISFYANYASLWLVLGIAIFGVILWVREEELLWQKSAKVLLYFAAFASYQIFTLISFIISYDGKIIAGSVNENSLTWFTEQFNFLIGLKFLFISLPVFFAFIFFLIKRKANFFNEFLLAILFSPLLLSLTYSFLLQPIFLARNLFVVSISFILILGQFNKSIKNTILMVSILVFYAVQSVNGESFLYIKGLESFVKKNDFKEAVVFNFIRNEDHLLYYLSTELKFPKIINAHNKLRASDLLVGSGKRIFLVLDPNILGEFAGTIETIYSQACSGNICEEIIIKGGR